MGDLGRKYLTGSIMLSRNEDGSLPEKYIIKSVIGEGGSTVCYEAVRLLNDGSEETGKLKEFYPVDAVAGNRAWYYSLERLPNGQLIPGIGTVRKFHEMCRDYLDTYKLLRKVMVDNPKNEVLKNYIQHGEILYGCMEHVDEQEARASGKLVSMNEGRPTVYIWSTGMAGKGFDKYLLEVRKNPLYRAEERLRDILSVIDALTDCIKALHTAGLMHMDIKPSNFLVPYDSDFGINASNISLFDINTLSSIKSNAPKAFGTNGYRAPEVAKGKADNRSDIYSIGAMLFYAVVITSDIPDGLYRDFYYPSIAQLVKHSELFSASEITSDVALMSRICKILEKCLEKNPRKRYQSCSELKTDVEKALQRLDKLLLAPVEKCKEGLSDPTLVIQKLLYEHPLYESVSDGTKEINVLVLGAGTYGQKFIDICLQAGQISNKYLNITAVSNESDEDKEAYLRFRPGLSEFVNIDGLLGDEKEKSYADIQFKSLSQWAEYKSLNPRFSRNIQDNIELIRRIIKSAVCEGKEYNYIFVSLGEDKISQQIAKLCSEILREEVGFSCPVCYISQKTKQGRKSELKNKLYPVCINETVNISNIDQNLEQMAFNTHISWMNSLNFDVNRERIKFFTSEDVKDKYNRESSMAFALSIKYKLHSVHIDCSDPYEAAREFSEKILENKSTNTEARKKFDCLVDLEHRRWVLEKVTDGWTAPRNEKGELLLDECIVRGSVKDSVKRTHPCLVLGSESSPLNDEEYIVDNHAKWNEGDIDSELDELDRMSIELHRCFKKQADLVKQEGFLQNADLILIQNMIPLSCDKAQKAFKQYQFALKNIINGVESYSRQYDYYQDALKESLGELTAETQMKINERLEVLKRAIFPVIESNLYRNYKANDEVLVNKIPYILTYRYMSSIAVGFEDGKNQNGRNEAVFANVAAVTVLSPKEISFLYCFDKNSEIDLFVRKVSAVINYLGKRKVQSKIKLLVSCLTEVSNKDRENLQFELEKLQRKYKNVDENAQIEEWEIFDAVDYVESGILFAEYLKSHPVELYDGGNYLFPSAYDNALFIQKVENLKIPYFEFQWRKKTFSKYIGCEYLRYVKDNSFIRIQDMFALMNAADTRFNMPEFADDYESLWKIYIGEYLSFKKFENGVGNWNRLCMCLGKYESEQKPLAKIVISTNENPRYKTLTFFLPEYTFITVKYILQRLKEYSIAEEGSSLINYASDTCRLELIINSEYEKQLSVVFSNPQTLLGYYGIVVNKYKSYNAEYVEIRCNNLNVVDANLDIDGTERYKYVYGVLQQLEKAHFIYQLKQNSENPKKVSFIYSSPRLKKLLTSAGEILEVYAYYEVLKTGYFDDVASGYEFNWEYGDVRNELDLILTKGFRSIIVECKAVVELKLDYYHKLHSIADQFGIGTQKVLLGNTYAHSNTVANDLNDMQKNRGEQLHIKTISDEEDIINIGQTLKNLMEALE